METDPEGKFPKEVPCIFVGGGGERKTRAKNFMLDVFRRSRMIKEAMTLPSDSQGLDKKMHLNDRTPKIK